ncbi:hypothetical protein [Brevibacillus dissolubilis]|uniref:hypothetical protein n=1 Tax=Brevibacillus dissolubilis TaxID=1844116 RepID=UPI001116E68E|nr:hypothetical protein [Brevibacillus dissolubilis]
MKRIASLLISSLFLLSISSIVYADSDSIKYWYKGANYTTSYYNNGSPDSTGGNSVAVLTAHSYTSTNSSTAREWVRIFGRLDTMKSEYPAYENWKITKMRVGMSGNTDTWIWATTPQKTDSVIPDWVYDLAGSIPQFGSYASLVKVLTNNLAGGITVDIPSPPTNSSITITSYSGLPSTVSLPNAIKYNEADGNTSGKLYGFDGRFLFDQPWTGSSIPIKAYGNVQYSASMLINSQTIFIYPYTADVVHWHTIHS